jgi:DNA-binding PadR family transcriptional regulator
MFFRHFQDRARCMHPGFSGHGRHGRRGMGGREGRMFDGGDLRLVILALIAEKPRHGYEIIKDIGERVGGDYSPSPGVVYPTLTYLEEIGHASVTTDHAGRKLYDATADGKAHLVANKAQVDAIFARFSNAEETIGPGVFAVRRAVENLRASVRLRVLARQATPDQVQTIVDLLDDTAKKIEKL